MANEPKIDPQRETNSQRDVAIRSACLDMAVRAQCGLVYTDDGKAQYSEVEIVKAASKFEDFIKGKKKEEW